MRKTIVAAVTALVLFGLATTASAYQVTSSRPRLFFRADQVAELQGKCGGIMASDYNDIKNWCDQNMSASLPLSSDETYEYHITAMCFMWQMSGNTAYASRAKTLVQSAMGRGFEGQRTYTRSLALFLDWCYGYLSASERSIVGNELIQSVEVYKDSEVWETMNNYHSKLTRIKEFAYAGLALYGAGINNAKAVEYCDFFREHTYGAQHTLACVDEIGPDGSYFEGDYNMIVLGSGFRRGLWLWYVATDENPFDESSNLMNMSLYYTYEIFAKNGPAVTNQMSGSKQGDSHHHTIDAAQLRLAMYALAHVYNDSRAQWLADHVDYLDMGYLNRYDRWELIVNYDPSIASTPPYDLEDAKHFEGVGTVYMRTGFDYSHTSDDIYAVFRCEALLAGHTHAHQNHFLIARGPDLLAIDSGDYDASTSSHHMHYFERTIAHNTITVYDPSETTFAPYTNDGGQTPPSKNALPIHFGDAADSKYYRGGIEAYTNNGEYTYVKGDATAAYSPGKVELFTREMYFMKPDTFVILDRVRATSASYPKHWLLHTLNEPVVSGNTFTVVEGESKMVVTTVLPAGAGIEKIGGPGREFEVNGVNYPPSGGATWDAGAWRVEVTPTEAADEHIFLHVLQVMDAGAQPVADVTLVEGEEMLGVSVDGETVLFRTSAEPVESETYQVQ